MDKTQTPACRRLVVKFGTTLLTGGGDHLDTDTMSRLVAQVAKLHKEGLEVVIVTSGAVAAGRLRLGIKGKVKGVPYKQMLASVGQSRLMSVYEKLFDEHGITVAQALLTKRDLSDRAGYLNARNTLMALLERRVVPIINENDVVSADEMHDAKFGDNDNLSAMVANLVDADWLILLSDIDGLYTSDPRRYPDARLIPEVAKIDSEIEKLASGTQSEESIGGMVTKIEAARFATACGITVLIANGRTPDILPKLIAKDAICTSFLPATSRLESRKRWMLSGLSIKGTLTVDDGAATALVKQKRSLLPSGVREVSGSFQQGDIVNICDLKGNRLGSGIANYGAEDIEKIKGRHSTEIVELLGYDFGAEVVHRNNLVII
ncbi:MAG: glutamate 5-kinase [Chloroflexota bacterium]